VKEFLEYAFELLGIEDGISRFVRQDTKFMRPSEVDLLIGDASKARHKLNWSPKVDFQTLVEIMISNDLKLQAAVHGIDIENEPRFKRFFP
jgi:GDPmannose 4,6-dehydratase